MQQLLTCAELAKTLNITQSHAYQLARKFPAGVRVKVGRHVRIDEVALRKWIADGGSLSQSRSTSQEGVPA
jgi:excisionase family DNA binding protein